MNIFFIYFTINDISEEKYPDNQYVQYEVWNIETVSRFAVYHYIRLRNNDF